jgi:hypothetical protein
MNAKQKYLNNEIKSNISKTICILFIYGGFSLHLQRVFTSTLISLNLNHENSSHKLHYNKNFMFLTSNDLDLMVCITIADGRELGGRGL